MIQIIINENVKQLEFSYITGESMDLCGSLKAIWHYILKLNI